MLSNLKRLDPYFEGVSFPFIAGHHPLVSILVAYYNNFQYLDDFIKSVLCQTYKNFEVIIIDDASTEGNAISIIQKYRDTRIRYYYSELNQGAAISRTKAFHMSRGDFIVAFDPDDIMHPWFLQAMMAEILSSSKPHIVTSHLMTFGDESSLWKRTIKSDLDLTMENWIGGTALTYRYLWEKTGGQSSSAEIRNGSQDWEFWLHCLKIIGHLHVRCVPLPLFLYRRHQSSIASSSGLHEISIRKRIIIDHLELLNKYKTHHIFLAGGYYLALRSLLFKKDYANFSRNFYEGLTSTPITISIPKIFAPFLKIIVISLLHKLRKIFKSKYSA